MLLQKIQKKTSTISKVREKWDNLEKLSASAPVLTLKDRRTLAETLNSYLNVQNPDLREMPGYDVELSNFERIREGKPNSITYLLFIYF